MHDESLTSLPPEQEARFLELNQRLEEWNRAGAEGPCPVDEMEVSQEEFRAFRGWQQQRMRAEMAAWIKERETAIPPEPGPLSAEQEARFQELERRMEEWNKVDKAGVYPSGVRPIEAMRVSFVEFQIYQRWLRYQQWRARQVAAEDAPLPEPTPE